MKRLILWAPLIVFMLFLGVFAAGLIKPESKTIRSHLVGKPLPAFMLAPGTATHPASPPPIFATASRNCSTSSPAGACRARQRHRNSTNSPSWA